MRVFYDGHIFQLQKYGGISRYIFEVITRMLEYEDYEPEVFMGIHRNSYGLENYRDRFAAFWGHKIPHIKHTGFIRRAIDRISVKRFSSRLPRDDRRIQHATYYQSYDIGSTIKVETAHDMIYQKFQHYFPNSEYIIAMQKRAYLAADGIICISESTKRDLLDLYGDQLRPACKIKVIYHGSSILPDAPNNVNILIDAPYFLFVGLRGGYKNFERLAQAFATDKELCRSHYLVCFGGGQFSKDELSMFQKLKIVDRVKQISGSDSVLSYLYRHATAFVYPSEYEGFGLPPLEAMGCSCPVLASNTSSIPEVVGDAGIMFDPYSINELSASMRKAAKDNSLRLSLINKGRERCNMFTWEKTAAETMEFYRELAG